MFKVTEVSYTCSESMVDKPDAVIIYGRSDTAPMPALQHPIDWWWVQSGDTYRTPRMTGSAL